MDLFANEIGMDRAAIRRKNFIPPDAFPYDNPSGLGTASAATKIYIDSGNYEPALNKALIAAGYDDLAKAQGRGEEPRQAPRARALDLHRGLRRRAVEVDRRRRRGLGRGDVGVGQHQGPPDRQGRSSRWAPSPRARATRRPTPRSSPTSSASRWTTSSSSTPTRRARRSATARTAAGPRRSACTAAIKATDKIKDKARRYAAHMLEASPDDIEIVGAEYRVKGSPDKKKTLQEIAFALDLGFEPAGRDGAVPRRDGLLRHAELHLAVRDPHRDRRGRRGDRRGRAQALRRGRRRRQEDQPDDRRRPAPRRHRPGRRPGALGDGRLRRRRPAPVGLDARLRAAAGLVAAELRARRDGDAVAGQPDRRQGRRRGRLHRLDRRRGERRQRRARAARHHAISTCRSPAQTVWRAMQSAKGAQA